MAMAEKNCSYFLEALASKAPVPGGGGGGAMGGAIGMALSNMVGNLTVGKKKFAEVEDEIRTLLEQGSQVRLRRFSLELVLADGPHFDWLVGFEWTAGVDANGR